jgi:hypothetical protein
MNKNTILLVGAVAGIFLLSKRSGAAARPGVRVPTSPAGMQPARVGRNEKVTAKTFVVLRKQRPGFTYVPAKMLPTGLIEFTSPKEGLFTRYVFQSAGKVFAEIK